MWLKLTTSDGSKELFNMVRVDNIVKGADGGSVLWWFGGDRDQSFEVEETVDELAQVLGAIGKQ